MKSKGNHDKAVVVENDDFLRLRTTSRKPTPVRENCFKADNRIITRTPGGRSIHAKRKFLQVSLGAGSNISLQISIQTFLSDSLLSAETRKPHLGDDGLT